MRKLLEITFIDHQSANIYHDGPIRLASAPSPSNRCLAESEMLTRHVRTAPLRSTKAANASRRNLQHLGIPDGRDVLAIYLLWRKQRSLRAPSSLPSTMRCEMDHDEIDRSESEQPAMVVLCSSIVRVDLLHVGAQFEGCGGALLGVGV
jgi:hypothetical protein